MLDIKGKLINPECRIENTNSCNASCIMCAHSEMTRPKGTMSHDFFVELIEQAKELDAKTISVFGFGEPFLDDCLSKKIEMCGNLGLESFITTNGSLCTWQRMYDLFIAGLNHIRFSIHGLYDNYGKIHKGLNFDNIMTNLFSTILLRDKVGWSDSKISITSISMNNNELENFGIHEMCNLAGVDYLELWKPHNWGTAKNYRKKTKERKESCKRPFFGPLQIQWDGMVIPCCFLTNAELILGNAHKQTLKGILKGKAYSEFRRKHEKGDLNGLPCENCDQLNIEQESPLLYSNRDPEKNLDTTSSIKFKL